MFSDGFKALLSRDVWASSDAAATESPEEADITRTDGWGVAYEQVGSGRRPQRTVWNRLLHEIVAALHDIGRTGVPRHDMMTDYVPSGGFRCFVTTPTGLWSTGVATGPSHGNATDPDDLGQIIWGRY